MLLQIIKKKNKKEKKKNRIINEKAKKNIKI
jgi:hypothetical protein